MGDKNKLKIGVFCSSFSIPKNEFQFNLSHLESLTFPSPGGPSQVKFFVHPQVYKKSLFFSGTDEERANGFWNLARDKNHSILWAARGGYGSLRVLEYLDKYTKLQGAPSVKKVLVGYSDISLLHTFVADRWGWSVLHAPMLSSRNLSIGQDVNWKNLFHALSVWEESMRWGSESKLLFKTEKLKLKKIFSPSGIKKVHGRLLGGNLATWVSQLGSPFHPKTEGAILFFEDVGEDLYRIDRLLQELRLRGGLRGVQGIVLGSFTNCLDYPAKTLISNLLTVPLAKRNKLLKSQDAKNFTFIRKPISTKVGVQLLFRDLAKREGIPVFIGIPSGHDPHKNEPLILNENYSVDIKPGSHAVFQRNT